MNDTTGFYELVVNGKSVRSATHGSARVFSTSCANVSG